MIHSGSPTGSPNQRRIYGAAAVCLHLLLLVGCISIPTASTPVNSLHANHHRINSNAITSVDFPLSSGLDEQLGWTFERARELVQLETGTDLTHVSFAIADEQAIQREVTHVTQNLVQEQFSNPHYAEFFLQKIIGDQQGTYAALYVDSQQKVLVSRALLRAYIDSLQYPSNVYPAMLALLIHELVHAADDVVYGIHNNREMSFKSSFTQSAAFEGHAQFVTRQICTRQDCLQGMAALETFMFETTQFSDPVAQSVQAISRNVLEYSYIEGERFLTELSKRANGSALIAQVLRQPPADPVQILVPDTYPDKQREARNSELFGSLQQAIHPWSELPWRLVETSPIKGIDVRNDPSRRLAAVEGFTELIVSMTGAQLYNQSKLDISPVDIMLIEAESRSTARLFAESFVNRSATTVAAGLGDAAVDIERSENQTETGYAVYIVSPNEQVADAAQTASVIGLSGRFVVQISASTMEGVDTLESYTRAVMSTISRIVR